MLDIKNISNNLIVFSLKDNSTVRLRIKETTRVKKDLVPNLVYILEKDNRLLVSEVEVKSVVQVEKKENEKEEK